MTSFGPFPESSRGGRCALSPLAGARGLEIRLCLRPHCRCVAVRLPAAPLRAIGGGPPGTRFALRACMPAAPPGVRGAVLWSPERGAAWRRVRLNKVTPADWQPQPHSALTPMSGWKNWKQTKGAEGGVRGRCLRVYELAMTSLSGYLRSCSVQVLCARVPPHSAWTT
jgi:hypothetical protein